MVIGGGVAVKAMPLRGRPRSSLDSHPPPHNGASNGRGSPNDTITSPRQLSVCRRTVGFVNAVEHWQAWLHRYGDDYSTDEERRAAYRDFKANLAALSDVFDETHREG